MKKRFNILIVDDEVEYQKAFGYILEKAGYNVLTASSGERALEIMRDTNIDLLITDLKMPEMDGITLIRNVRAKNSEIDIIVLTAFGTISSAVESIKEGATGYFVKGSDMSTFLIEIDRIYKLASLEKSNMIFQTESLKSDLFLETKSKSFQLVLDNCLKAANTDINILLLGESGVGKEVIARFIHENSKRSNNHFIPVNCQTYSNGIVDSELFGHEKGAFTGATERRIGRFEASDMGTLFLDEIGDLSLEMQGKILRALETRSIERLGSNRNIELDNRLISATNKNIYKLIQNEKFREDLLYRINSLEILITPLRERKEDLPGLINFFIKKISNEQKKSIEEIDSKTMELLLEYNYPGNIRELRNILERMIALTDDSILRINNFNLNSNFNKTKNNIYNGLDLRSARSEFEKSFIDNVLRKCIGDLNEASSQLGITKRQLWNKIKEYDIEIQ